MMAKKIDELKKLLYYFTAVGFPRSLLLFLESLYLKITRSPMNLSFAQNAEDVIIWKLFREKRDGFYVDAGCNEPIRISNTFLLYLNGWKGINIDANSKLIAKFNRIRKKDINVNAALSDVRKEVTFYQFNKNAVNTINEETVARWKTNWQVRQTNKMTTVTVEEILDKHLPAGQQLDVLSVDVEGEDLNVLKSVNFSRYRPRLVIVEDHNFNHLDYASNNIYAYMVNAGYVLIGYAVMNCYFADKSWYTASLNAG